MTSFLKTTAMFTVQNKILRIEYNPKIDPTHQPLITLMRLTRVGGWDHCYA